MLATLINGLVTADATHALSVEDRGLSYGDGVFETMRLHQGAIRYFESHLARLRLGCDRLGISMPTDALLHSDIAALTKVRNDGVVKLIVTRGVGGRGYRSGTSKPSRIAMLYPLPPEAPTGIAVRWCVTRLARNALLAGIKHLNRLEQVLAQNEWNDQHIAEGLMLDTEGELIGATASNLFVVADGILATSDLRFSGIRGVLREQVIAVARSTGMVVDERALWPEDLLNATEVFVTNAVRGIRPVVALDARRWSIGPITERMIADINICTN